MVGGRWPVRKERDDSGRAGGLTGGRAGGFTWGYLGVMSTKISSPASATSVSSTNIRRSRGICPYELNLGRVVGSLVWPVEVGDILGAFLGVALRVSLWVDESSGLRSGA